MSAEPDLDALERFLIAAVSHQDGLEAGLERPAARDLLGAGGVAELILPSASLSAEDRLGIYADMYYWRLVDVLAEDFRRLRDFLGAEEFGRQARAYLHRHPSGHPNLARLGDGFPDFLRAEAEDLPMRAVAVDLARLELAFSRVFDAAEDSSLEAEALVGIAPEDWPELRLETVSALEILRLDHDLDGFLDAGMPPAVPQRPGEHFVLLHRRDYQVYRLPLSRPQAALLLSLRAGRPLLEALADLADAGDFDPDRDLAELELWFRRWAGMGLFRSRVRPDAG